ALELSAEDRAVMETPAGKIVAAAIGKNADAKETLHPKMSLELDLGLDSLGRAEVFAALEAALGTELSADEAAKALTIADAIDLVNEYGKGSELLSANAGDIESAVDVHWGKLV